MSDDLHLGVAADWARLLERRQSSAERMALDTMRLVARVAVQGPASERESIEILGNDALLRLLGTAWQELPPSPQLRENLAANPYGRSLLRWAPDPQPTESAGVAITRLALLRRRIQESLVPLPLFEVQTSRSVGDTTVSKLSVETVDGVTVEITRAEIGDGSMSYTASVFVDQSDSSLIIAWSSGDVSIAAMGETDKSFHVDLSAPRLGAVPAAVALSTEPFPSHPFKR